MVIETSGKRPTPVIPGPSSVTRRARSTITFPYGDLDSAESVAKGVLQKGGTACELDQLAAVLGTTVTSGSFRVRVSAAHIFGLTKNEKGKVALTDLGQDLVHPGRERQARVAAFLTVPLYKALYEKYKGRMLPPSEGLETEIETLGVAPKQKAAARQTFIRSAEHAGFFEHGKERLVAPTGEGKPEGEGKTPPGDISPNPTPTKPPLAVDPVVASLFDKHPPANKPWPAEERFKWVLALVKSWEFLYPDESKKVIEVTLKPSEGTAP